MLRVLTLNLWNDTGPWPARARRIRAWLDHLAPDVVGFQEALRGPGYDQVAELLEHRLPHRDYVCAAPVTRGVAPGRADAREFGNAIAARWPITDREAVALPDAGDGETRAALSVRIAAPVGALSFTCTHLNWKLRHGAVRERQVQAVGDLVLRRRIRDGFPPILVGDFNAEPDAAEIRYLVGLQSLDGRSMALLDAWRMGGDGSAGITWSNRNPYAAPAFEPDRRIDYVFTGFPLRDSGLGRIERCRVACDQPEDGVWPSDHFAVYVELRDVPLGQ